MKKALSLLLIFAAFVACIGCTPKQDTPSRTAVVYYRTAEISYGTSSGVIAPCVLDVSDCEDNISSLLTAYLSHSPTGNYASTFPADTQLISIDLNALTAKIVLSDGFAQLSGLDLSIACACLTQTVIAFTDCQEVIISANTAQLDGRNYITLSRDSYLLIDESVAQ